VIFAAFNHQRNSSLHSYLSSSQGKVHYSVLGFVRLIMIEQMNSYLNKKQLFRKYQMLIAKTSSFSHNRHLISLISAVLASMFPPKLSLRFTLQKISFIDILRAPRVSWFCLWFLQLFPQLANPKNSWVP